MTYSLSNYADWAAIEVLSATPEGRLRSDWIKNWSRTLNAVKGADGIHELVSIICARWEFLGGLYLGTIGNTGVKEAVAYVCRFLVPINADYGQMHDMSGRAAGGSEFFTMFRNRTLHGGTPAAIAEPGNVSVVGWWVGSDATTQTNHLRIMNDKMHVDGDRFFSEFMSSLDGFATYLKQNQDLLDGGLPIPRWQRGFWARYRPQYLSDTIWMQEGFNRGIPQQ